MKHELRISIMECYQGARWQERAKAAFPVERTPDIVFCMGEMHPGYTFDQDAVDKFLEDNKTTAFGEGMFMAINEGDEHHGVYWADDDYGSQDVVAVEWHLRHTLDDLSEIGKSKVVTLKDANPEHDGTIGVRVVVENHNLGLCVHVNGYGCYGCEEAGPVFIELYEGHLRAILWPDINNEEPLIVDLEGAHVA